MEHLKYFIKPFVYLRERSYKYGSSSFKGQLLLILLQHLHDYTQTARKNEAQDIELVGRKFCYESRPDT